MEGFRVEVRGIFLPKSGKSGDYFFEVHSPLHLLILNFRNWPWDITSPLPITPMRSNGNKRGRLYHAHGTLRLFMTEFIVSLSSS